MIILKKSRIEVHDYHWDDSYILQSMYMTYDMTTHSHYILGLEYNENEKVLYLPRGMDVRKVEKLVGGQIIIDKDYDKFDIFPETVKIKYLPKNDVQKEAIRFVLGLAEYKDHQFYSQLSINLSTGKGKTYVAISSMAYEECRFIVIAPIRDWLGQWKDKALEYTNYRPEHILTVTSSIIDKIIYDKIKIDNVRMFLCTHSSIGTYAAKNGWSSIDVFFEKIRVKYKIFDEAHMNFESMMHIDFHSNVYKTLYLTATPGRSDKEENKIWKNYFEYVPAIDLYDHERDAKTKYISVHFNSHPTTGQIAWCTNKYGLNKSKFVKYSLNNEQFWKVIYICFCEAVLTNKGRTLILVETNEAIYVMKQWIESWFPEFIGKIGTFHGTTKVADREIAKQHKIVITNRQCGGTCLDIANLGLCFPVLAPAKSKIIAQQLFGRVGREGAILDTFVYLDVIDEGFKKIKEFYSFRLPVFMKYATSCSRVLMKDNDIDTKYENYYMLRHPVQIIKKCPWDIRIPEVKKCPWDIKLS